MNSAKVHNGRDPEDLREINEALERWSVPSKYELQHDYANKEASRALITFFGLAIFFLAFLWYLLGL